MTTILREPGDDSQQEKEARQARRDNGKPIFSARNLDKGFSILVLEFAKYGKANPYKKSGPLYRSCEECLRVFRRDYEAMLRGKS